MTLAFEDANSKLFDIVSVADVDAKERVDDSLVQVWKPKFGHKAKFLFIFWAQGLFKILKLKFKQDFEGEVRSIFAADVWLKLWGYVWSKSWPNIAS